jgi:phage virion morphogenesis protein
MSATGTGVSITLDDHELREALKALGRLAVSWRGPLSKAGDYLVRSTQRRIETGTTAPDGTAWPQLSARYARRKKGPGMLREQGMAGGLMGSIHYRVSGDTVQVGSNKAYARIHQLGGDISQGERTQTVYRHANLRTGALKPGFVKRANSNFATDHKVKARRFSIPARPYLGVSDADRREILAIFRDFALAALK